MFSTYLLLTGIFSGSLGALLGLGGGIFTIPILTILLKVDFHTAISMSLSAIIAKSVLSTAINIRSRLINIPLGLSLLPSTLLGSTLGGRVGLVSSDTLLSALFTFTLVVTATLMYTQRNGKHITLTSSSSFFFGSYCNKGTQVQYTPSHIIRGIITCTVGGFVGGMLGIGGGSILVPAMNIINKVPIKAAIATSLFIIGISAIPPTLIYFSREIITPHQSIFIIVGAFVGTVIGNKVSTKLKDKHIAKLFSGVLIVDALIMAVKTIQGFTF